MSSSLVSVLHLEERSIVAELRTSKPFQRLEAIRRLLALYDVQPSVATGLDMPATAEPDRASGEVIHFTSTVASPPPAAPVHAAPAAPTAVMPAATAPAMSAASAPTAIAHAISLPGPGAAVVAMAEAAVADAVIRRPAPMHSMETESSSVVSSVRAALLGIGKG